MVVLQLGQKSYSLIRGVHLLCAIQIAQPTLQKVSAIVIRPDISQIQLFTTINYFAKEAKEGTPLTFIDQVRKKKN